MARPDCDDGWFKIASELHSAISYADFTKLADRILGLAFLQIFGRGVRPRYVVLVPKDIVKQTGKLKQNVYWAIKELVLSGVLVPIPGKEFTYKFVKDYEKWVKVGRKNGSPFSTEIPRLDPSEVADCKTSPAYQNQFERRSNQQMTVTQLDYQPDSGVTQMDYESNPDGLPGVTQMDYPTSLMRIPNDQTQTRNTKEVTNNPKHNGTTIAFARDRASLNEESISIERESINSSSSGEISRARETTKTTRKIVLDKVGLRLSEWIKKLLDEEGWPKEDAKGRVYAIRVDSLVSRWIDAKGDPVWCAEAFQAAIDRGTEDPVLYADSILREMAADQKAGEVPKSPGICSFVADPEAKAPETKPSPKLSRIDRESQMITRMGEDMRNLLQNGA